MFLRIGAREIPLRLILIAIGGVLVLSIGVTVAVMIVRGTSDNQDGIDVLTPAAERFRWIGVEDFVLEDELARGAEPRWIPFRDQKARWTDAEVQEHWIDPREIGIEVLDARVNRDIRRRLEAVQ